MTEKVGLPPSVVPPALEREMAREFPRIVFDELVACGVPLRDVVLLDVGAGLGGAAAEAAARGAVPIAIEPGEGWRELAAERVNSAGRGAVVAAVGESLPIRDDSIDVAVSLMVLEHVSSPEHVLREVFRVLKPGGVFYLACENYLAFSEAHYQVAWLPLLPKPIGAIYLRLRGRPTAFLYESVTYVTRPAVLRMLRQCGFEFLRKERIERALSAPERVGSGMKRRLIESTHRYLSTRRLVQLAFLTQNVRDSFSGPIVEILRKPDRSQGHTGADRD